MTQKADLIHKMAEFFKSEEFFKKGEGARLELSPDDVRCMNKIIKALPSIKSQEGTGHWIGYDCYEEKYDKIKCSECGRSYIVDSYHWCDIGFTKDDLKFCPSCGVRMKGE